MDRYFDVKTKQVCRSCGGAPIGSADIADLWSLTWLFLGVPAFSGHDCDVADVVVQ